MNESPETEQLTLARTLILIAGASIGLWLLAVGQKGGWMAGDLSSPSTWMLTFYASLSGITMAAAVLLVIEWVRYRRPWTPPCVALFVTGASAWIFLPMVAVSMVRQSRQFDPFGLHLRRLMAHDPGQFAFEGFYYFWPIASLLLFVGCQFSGQQATNWLRLRGWWAEWLGMWVLLFWSLPSAVILGSFVRVYFLGSV